MRSGDNKCALEALLPDWVIRGETLNDLEPELSGMHHIVLVTSASFRDRGIVGDISNLLGDRLVLVVDDVQANPTVENVDQFIERMPSECDAVVGLGGGSAIDVSKVLVTALERKCRSTEQLVCDSLSEMTSSVLLLTLPTTAGTGAEVTPFATVWDQKALKKCSVVGRAPDRVLLLPRLMLSLNAQNTLFPALDALSHGLESLWNINRTEESQHLAECAVEAVVESLPRVLQHPDDLDARGRLQLAAVLAGLAIKTTKTAIAHAISYPLTLAFSIPHGLACSFTLKAILQRFGEELMIHPELVDKVEALLEALALGDLVEDYVSETQALALFNDHELEPSRVRNFNARWTQDDVLQVVSMGIREGK